jgi:MFS family permease
VDAAGEACDEQDADLPLSIDNGREPDLIIDVSPVGAKAGILFHICHESGANLEVFQEVALRLGENTVSFVDPYSAHQVANDSFKGVMSLGVRVARVVEHDRRPAIQIDAARVGEGAEFEDARGGDDVIAARVGVLAFALFLVAASFVFCHFSIDALALLGLLVSCECSAITGNDAIDADAVDRNALRVNGSKLLGVTFAVKFLLFEVNVVRVLLANGLGGLLVALDVKEKLARIGQRSGIGLRGSSGGHVHRRRLLRLRDEAQNGESEDQASAAHGHDSTGMQRTRFVGWHHRDVGETGHVDSTDVGTPPVAMAAEGAQAGGGTFAPLKLPLFRDRWVASTVSSVGTWMQDTAGTWLMTVLTTSPLLIALMQTAASLPVLFLGLLAGATADIYERRRLLIFWQCWMLAAVAVLAVLTFMGIISPVMLLLLTFFLNIGSAMNNPAWQAIVPELVPREEIPNAVTLNAASNNIARAVGPALGGLMIAAFLHPHIGAGWVFALNSASFAGVIWILWRWKRTPVFKSALPAERIAGSVRSGLRYVRYAPDLQASLARAFVFPFFVSAVWSLLALVAKSDLHQGAMGYGILNGCLGAGAVLGATMLSRIRKRVDADKLLFFTTLYYVATLLILAFVKIPAVVIVTLLGAGFAWTTTMSTLNVSVQLSVPGWVYARALGTYLMTFQGGMALGSVVWGAIAEKGSTKIALICAAAGLAASMPITRRFHILKGALPNLTPYQWKRPMPALAAAPGPDDGPVRISVDYHVPRERYAEFTRVIHDLEGVRLRGGAVRWGIYRDAANAEHLNETFIMESWLDFLRSRERMTAADQEIRERVYALHSDPAGSDVAPRITYQVWAGQVVDEFHAAVAD